MSISSTVTSTYNTLYHSSHNTHRSTTSPYLNSTNVTTNRPIPSFSASGRMTNCVPLARAMSPLEHKNLKFLITDCPINASLEHYLSEFQSRGVTDVVRVCEATYDKTFLESYDIKVHDWPFKDGGLPSNEIILSWLTLCEARFGPLAFNPSASPTPSTKINNNIVTSTTPTDAPMPILEGSEVDPVNEKKPVIVIHCVAGLGRAPVLVAIALIECGMSPLDTIEFVRKQRKGAFNSIQLSFLVDSYKRQWGKKSKSSFIKLSSASSGLSVVGVMMKRVNSNGLNASDGNTRRKSDESGDASTIASSVVGNNLAGKSTCGNGVGPTSSSPGAGGFRGLFVKPRLRPSSMALT